MGKKKTRPTEAEMASANRLIDTLKQHYQCESDAEAAHILGVSGGQISHWRNGTGHMTLEHKVNLWDRLGYQGMAQLLTAWMPEDVSDLVIPLKAAPAQTVWP